MPVTLSHCYLPIPSRSVKSNWMAHTIFNDLWLWLAVRRSRRWVERLALTSTWCHTSRRRSFTSTTRVKRKARDWPTSTKTLPRCLPATSLFSFCVGALRDIKMGAVRRSRRWVEAESSWVRRSRVAAAKPWRGEMCGAISPPTTVWSWVWGRAQKMRSFLENNSNFSLKLCFGYC